MEIVFYMFAILAIMWEVTVIADTKKAHEKMKSFKEKEDVEEMSTNKKLLVFLILGYFTWNVIGLFTSQWPLFLTLIIISLTIPKKLHYSIRFIDAVITLFILAFIILNKYHLRIDVIEFAKSLF